MPRSTSPRCQSLVCPCHTQINTNQSGPGLTTHPDGRLPPQDTTGIIGTSHGARQLWSRTNTTATWGLEDMIRHHMPHHSLRNLHASIPKNQTEGQNNQTLVYLTFLKPNHVVHIEINLAVVTPMEILYFCIKNMKTDCCDLLIGLPCLGIRYSLLHHRWFQCFLMIQ